MQKGYPMKRRTARENAFVAAFEESFRPGSMEEIIAYSREAGELEEKAPFDAVVDNSYAEQAAKAAG